MQLKLREIFLKHDKKVKCTKVEKKGWFMHIF